MERHVLVGRYAEQRGQHLKHNINVTVAIEEKNPHTPNPADRQPKISICGDIGGRQMGQVNATLAEMLDCITFAPGWSRERLAQLLTIWERWHMNDLKAGCEHQRAAGWDKRRIDPNKPADAYGTYFPGQRNPSWNLLGWIRPEEHPDGLMTRPCEVCGYKYGTAWIYEQPPAEVLAFLEAIIRDDRAVAGRSALEDFLVRQRITSHAAKIEERPGGKDWGPASRHFRVTLTNQASGNRMIVYFSQGSGHTKAPRAHEVLACIARDVASLDGTRFEEWASDLGMDSDSRKALRMFEAIQKQREDLKVLMGHHYAEFLALGDAIA